VSIGPARDTAEESLTVANPIYHEVIPRQLTYINQTLLDSVIARQWYINPDGSIAVEKLLQDFQQFFRENSEAWIQRFDQHQEAGPQLLLQAYLQRVINGGGRIDREYGLGRGRTDILLTWPYGPEVTTTSGTTRGSLVQKAVFELKILYGTKEKTLAKGLEQTKLYLDQVGLKAGHLLIFNRDRDQTWDDKIYREEPPVRVSRRRLRRLWRSSARQSLLFFFLNFLPLRSPLVLDQFRLVDSVLHSNIIRQFLQVS
jgi:hypothetical protein